MTPQRIVLGAWLAMIGLATVKAVAGPQKGLPAPSVYLGSGVLFTALYGAAAFLGPLAAVTAVAVDVGALLAPYLGQQTGPLNQLAGFLDGLSGGKPAGPGASGVSGTSASPAPGTMAA
jgi:hypothetical protein